VTKSADQTPAALTKRPPGYAEWLAELKATVHAAQQRAALSVNRELLELYWQIGRDILDRQSREGWGKRIVEQFSADLRAAFPEAKGFSRANLMYMRAFAEGLARAGNCPTGCWTIALYLTAVDEQLKAPDDAPTIGLLLCKNKNQVVAEYALRNTTSPMGVAEYQLVEALPKDLEGNLPSIEQIERELGEVDE
jgi:hypothetical protein